MKMRHGDDNDVEIIDSIDQTEGKTRQQTAPQAGLDFRTRGRKGRDTTRRAIQFIEKFRSQSGCLMVIPCHGIVKLSLSRREKDDLHDARCFAITSA